MDKYYSENIALYNSVLSSLGLDWFVWDDFSSNIDSGYFSLIQGYLSSTDSIADILRGEVGSNKMIGDIYLFLFSTRQCLELLLKRLCVLYCDEAESHVASMGHKISNLLNLLKSVIDWYHYDLNFDNVSLAVDFMNDKDQLVKYPVDMKGRSHKRYMIHLSDWLHLIHALYAVYVDGLSCLHLKISLSPFIDESIDSDEFRRRLFTPKGLQLANDILQNKDLQNKDLQKIVHKYIDKLFKIEI